MLLFSKKLGTSDIFSKLHINIAKNHYLLCYIDMILF